MEWDPNDVDDVGSRDFRFAVTGMLMVVAIAIVLALVG
jgi:hypothetical protein